MMFAFEEAVARELGTMIREGSRLLAAVSGGADSTALLAALAALRRDLGFRLFCLHVDHGIRPREESRGDYSSVHLRILVSGYSICEILQSFLTCGVLL
ncbi:MAG: hypothetical protein LBG08_08935 [Spirochaetaceae bacterium]|jgi:tRNA(Ile)-lysidine synthase|nr:hypothetical protein [Spirochaetaceae bacterium]